MIACIDLYRAWAARACDLLQACYEDDPDKTEALVTCTSKRWGEQTPLELAITLKNQKFIGHPVVHQRVISKVWMGDLQSRTSALKVRFYLL